MHQTVKRLAVLFLVATLPLPAAFESLGDGDARTRSMGNASVAYGVGYSAFLKNPALLSTYPKTRIGLSVLGRGLGLDLGEKTAALQGSLAGIIALPNLLQGSGAGIAAGSLYANNNDQAQWVELQTTAGFGSQIIKTLAVGVSYLGQYWSLTVPNAGDLPTGFTPPFASSFSFGVLWTPMNFFSLGASGLNLLRPNVAALAGGEGYADRSVVLGLSFHGENAALNGDLDWKPDNAQIDIRVGAEGYIGKKLRLAAGVELVGPSRDLVPSLGFGVKIGPVDIDYTAFWSLSLGAGVGTHLLSAVFVFP